MRTFVHIYEVAMHEALVLGTLIEILWRPVKLFTLQSLAHQRPPDLRSRLSFRHEKIFLALGNPCDIQ